MGIDCSVAYSWLHAHYSESKLGCPSSVKSFLECLQITHNKPRGRLKTLTHSILHMRKKYRYIAIENGLHQLTSDFVHIIHSPPAGGASCSFTVVQRDVHDAIGPHGHGNIVGCLSRTVVVKQYEYVRETKEVMFEMLTCPQS